MSQSSDSSGSHRFPFEPPQRWHAFDSGPGGLSTAAIIGIIACVLGVIGVIIAFFLWYKRLERNLRAQQEHEEREGRASPSPHAVSEFVCVGLDSSRHTKKLEPLDRKLMNKADNSSKVSRQSLQPKPKVGIWDDPAILAMRLPAEDVIEDLLLAKSGKSGAEIYRGTYKSSVVVIKMLAHATQRPNMQKIETFFEEAMLYQSLHLTHTRLVSLVGVCWDSLSNVRIVTEFVARGDLRTHLNALQEDEETKGIDQQKTKIALHVSQALAALHALTPAVLYRDLTSRSVLLDENLDAKLGLFSLVSAQMQAQSSSSSSQGNLGHAVLPSLWLAPEVMMGAKHDASTDMYSFGILLSELDSNALPFANANTNQQQLPPMALLNQVALGKISAELSSPRTPVEIVELAKRCLSLEPSERPSAADAIVTLEGVLSESTL